MKKYYPGVDIMKFSCAILVIAIHTNPLRPYFPLLNFIIINVLGRVAVPFFFLSAGYFFASSLHSKGDQYFKGYIRSLIKLYVKWFQIYLLVLIVSALFNYGNTDPNLNNMISEYKITPLLVVGAILEIIFIHGSYLHLWFLPALISCQLIVYYFQKHFKVRYLLVIAAILYLFGLSETYYDFTKGIPLLDRIIEFYFKWSITTRNGLFFGLLFVALGFFIYHHEDRFKFRHPGILMIITLLLLLVEALLLRQYSLPLNYNIMIMQVPLAIFSFLYFKSGKFKNVTLGRDFHKYSNLIYLVHPMFLEFVPILLRFIKQISLWDMGWFRFLSVTLCALITVYMVIRHQKS